MPYMWNLLVRERTQVVELKPRGEDVATAVRNWLNEELKTSPTLIHPLGKFFLGASTGGLGLFATLFKFGRESPSFDCRVIICFLALGFSSLVAMWMAMPPVTKVTENLDLYKRYNELVGRTIMWMWIWFILWLVGFTVGLLELFA